jgi:hypothetical protein
MAAIFKEGPVEPISVEQQAEIEDTRARMSGIASTANEELKDLVDRAYRPFNVLMTNGYDTGGVSVDDYKEAASELLKHCPPADDAVFAQPNTASTPEPTSRDWVNELTSYGESARARLYNQTEFEAEVVQASKAANSDGELGYFLKVLERYCPDRVDAFDTVLRLHPEFPAPKGRE